MYLNTDDSNLSLQVEFFLYIFVQFLKSYFSTYSLNIWTKFYAIFNFVLYIFFSLHISSFKLKLYFNIVNISTFTFSIFSFPKVHTDKSSSDVLFILAYPNTSLYILQPVRLDLLQRHILKRCKCCTKRKQVCVQSWRQGERKVKRKIKDCGSLMQVLVPF